MQRLSKLGTLAFWEDAYAEERRNFEDFGDEGEIWFGEQVLETLLEWVIKLLNRRFPDTLHTRILEVGCGNGHVLRGLQQQGFKCLTGTDYSAQSIVLCQEITASMEMHDIRFEVDDILSTQLSDRFDLIIDKGTFDAISLSDMGDQKRSTYAQSVAQLLSPEGLLVITSCNFTVEELKEDFKDRFSFVDHIQDYKSFAFGGSEGTTVSTAAFQRNAS